MKGQTIAILVGVGTVSIFGLVLATSIIGASTKLKAQSAREAEADADKAQAESDAAQAAYLADLAIAEGEAHADLFNSMLDDANDAWDAETGLYRLGHNKKKYIDNLMSSYGAFA